MRRLFWIWLCRLAYRKASKSPGYGREPVGVPLRRDPSNPCPAYEPRPHRPGDWNDCETDGHYLCSECCHRAKEVLA